MPGDTSNETMGAEEFEPRVSFFVENYTVASMTMIRDFTFSDRRSCIPHDHTNRETAWRSQSCLREIFIYVLLPPFAKVPSGI